MKLIYAISFAALTSAFSFEGPFKLESSTDSQSIEDDTLMKLVLLDPQTKDFELQATNNKSDFSKASFYGPKLMIDDGGISKYALVDVDNGGIIKFTSNVEESTDGFKASYGQVGFNSRVDQWYVCNANGVLAYYNSKQDAPQNCVNATIRVLEV